MNTTACIELGIIQRTQGLKGHVLAWLSHDVSHLDRLKNLFIQINHTLVPYCIEHVTTQHRKAIIKLQGVDDPQAAHQLKGRSIFVLREALPDLPPQEEHLERLIGYHVADVREGSLGIVQDIYTVPQQKLLAVDYQGQRATYSLS
jgi:16S rRNA processing protein RimM